MCSEVLRNTVAVQSIIEMITFTAEKKPRKRKLDSGNSKRLCPSRETGIRTQGSHFIWLCLAFRPFICWPYPTSSIGLVFHHSQTPSGLSQSQLGWYCCLQKFIPTSAPLLAILRPSLFIPFTISFLKHRYEYLSTLLKNLRGSPLRE